MCSRSVAAMLAACEGVVPTATFSHAHGAAHVHSPRAGHTARLDHPSCAASSRPEPARTLYVRGAVPRVVGPQLPPARGLAAAFAGTRVAHHGVSPADVHHVSRLHPWI